MATTTSIPEVELAELVFQKRDLESKIKHMQERIDQLQEDILAQWAEDQVTQLKVKTSDGPALLYQSSQVWAKVDELGGADKELLWQDWRDLLTMNHAKAGSLLRELLAAGDERTLAELAEAGISPIEKTRINVKRSN